MATRYTLIEYMPLHLRGSHEQAERSGGGSGRYPANGAERVYVEGTVTGKALHPRWAEVIEDGIDALPEGETALSDIPGDALAPITYPREDGDV